jgi:hypothetical protein
MDEFASVGSGIEPHRFISGRLLARRLQREGDEPCKDLLSFNRFNIPKAAA